MEQLLGLVFGQAIGDAVGRYTEFLFEQSVKSRYPRREDFVFPPLPQNQLQRSFPEAHWTDDTDQMIHLLDMLCERNNKIDPILFAAKLKDWVDHGVPELGYFKGNGVGTLTLSLMNIGCFLTDPISASKKAWQGYLAPNGSLMRTSILAYRNLSYEETLADALTMTRTTHYDPRCSIATLVIVSILWDLINRTDEEVILSRARSFGSSQTGNFKLLSGESKSYTEEALSYFSMLTLEEMALNEQIGYVFKCMACGLYAFRNRKRPYKEVILDIILKGGDADTNASVAGAILGVYQGYSSLPKEWLEKLPFRKWLETKAEKFLKIIT